VEPEGSAEPPAAAEPGSGAPPPPRAGSLRRRLVGLAKVAVAVALVVVIVQKGLLDPRGLKQAIASPGSIALALLVGGTGISSSGLRWWILLRCEGIEVPLRRALELTWVGHFFNMVFPGAVSGDAVKMFYVGRDVPDRREEAWTTVLADRLIGLVALVSVSTLAALLNLEFTWSRPALRATFLTMLAVLGGALVGGAALALGVGQGWSLTRRVVKRVPFATSLARGYHVLVRLGRNPGGVALAFAISFFAHGLAVMNAWILGRAAGEAALSWVHYCSLFPVAMFANAIPISPGGIGVGEGVLSKLFEWAGGAGEDGVTVMILFRGMFLTLALVGALLYVLQRRHAPPPSDEAGSDAKTIASKSL